MAEMEKIWQETNWGNTEPAAATATAAVPFNSAYFRTPSAHVLNLRELARQGREREMSERRANVGKPKVVWGVPESEWEVWGEVQEDAMMGNMARLEEVVAEPETASVVSGVDVNTVDDAAASEKGGVASVTVDADATVEQEAMDMEESSRPSPSEVINRFKQDAQLGAGYSTSAMNALFAANMAESTLPLNEEQKTTSNKYRQP
jgi:hypothetical protein